MSQKFILHTDPTRGMILANAHAFLDRLPDTKAWQIEIKQYRKSRSDKQRNSLFGVAYKPIMEFVGLRGDKDKQELHTYFCGEYFGWTEGGSFSRKRPVRTTTKNERGEDDEIDTQTANDMYAFIQQRASEQGIYVPDPEPQVPDRVMSRDHEGKAA